MNSIIPLLGGDKGVGLSKKIFTFLVYNILPPVQIKGFKQVSSLDNLTVS